MVEDMYIPKRSAQWVYKGYLNQQLCSIHDFLDQFNFRETKAISIGDGPSSELRALVTTFSTAFLSALEQNGERQNPRILLPV